MKNLLSLAVLISGTMAMHAQLYVQPTTGPSPEASFIYANDTFIFVTEDIELAENPGALKAPSIALRNQSQLLQGNDAAQNAGDGIVSIYQEGTTNNYDYNFWASPVGIAKDNGGATTPDGNSSFSMRTGEETLEFPVDILLSQDGLIDNSISDGLIDGGGAYRFASRWLYSYQSTTTTGGSTNASWSIVQNRARLDAGWGFSMKGMTGTDTTDPGEGTANNNNDLTDGEGQRYDFRGRANNGTITGITVGENENSLIGNPYPSALDLSYFLIENSGTEGTVVNVNTCEGSENGVGNVAVTQNGVTTGMAYFWESDPSVASHLLEDYEGGYGTFSPMGSTCTTGMYMPATFINYDELGGDDGTGSGVEGDSYERRFSPVGQGFFVTGAASQGGSSDIRYSNDHRIYVPEGVANVSEFRNIEDETVAVPGIGVKTYYADVTSLPRPSQIRLAIGVNDTYARQIGIGFVDNATKGVDTAIDGENRSSLATDITFDIDGATGTAKENGFVINGIPYDETQLIPLLVKVGATSELKFKIFDTVDFPYNEVLLYDALTDTYHDILNDEALMLLEEDVYRERFYIRFTKESVEEENTEAEEENTEDTASEEQGDSEENAEDTATDDNQSEETTNNEDQSEDTSEEDTTDTEDQAEDTTEEETTTTNDESTDDTTETTVENEDMSVEEQSPFIEESILESFTIIQNNNNKQLEIYNPQNIEVSNVTLYDLTGKKVMNEMNMGGQTSYKFSTSNLATGVYVVQFITKSGLRKGRKVSVMN